MSETEKDIFDNLKSRIKEKRQYIDEKYGLMNITKETKEVSVQDALKGVVFDPSKSYKKLEDEINWDRGVLEGMKNQPEKAEQIAKTSQSLNDKIAIREFIKDSKENKINASKIKNYFESMITDNAKIKAGKEENGAIKEDNNDLPPVFVQKNKYIYETPQRIALKQAENMYINSSSVKSTLMSGKDWDTTLNYISQNSEDGYLIAIDKDDKYGYINQKNGIGRAKKTGTYITISEQYNAKFCNIYDIVGNAFEFTTEKSGENYIARGGCANYDYNLTNYGAGRFPIEGEETDGLYGWRPALFLK